MYIDNIYIYIKLPHLDSYGYKNNIIHVYDNIYIYIHIIVMYINVCI